MIYILLLLCRIADLMKLEKEFQAEDHTWLTMLDIATKYLAFVVSEQYFKDRSGEVCTCASRIFVA
jgi:hypothetical protein